MSIINHSFNCAKLKLAFQDLTSNFHIPISLKMELSLNNIARKIYLSYYWSTRDGTQVNEVAIRVQSENDIHVEFKEESLALYFWRRQHIKYSFVFWFFRVLFQIFPSSIWKKYNKRDIRYILIFRWYL